MKCMACSKELNKKETVFTEDRQSYCINPFTCNEHHPNSPTNILERKAAVKMFTEDELEVNIFENLDVSEDLKDRIIKVANKPQSIRLSKLEIAHYLIRLQETRNMASISEAVRYCVLQTMEREPIKSKVKADTETFTVTQRQPEVKTEAPKETGIKIVVEDRPLTAQEIIMKQIEEQEKEKESESEDIMSF